MNTFVRFATVYFLVSAWSAWTFLYDPKVMSHDNLRALRMALAVNAVWAVWGVWLCLT